MLCRVGPHLHAGTIGFNEGQRDVLVSLYVCEYAGISQQGTEGNGAAAVSGATLPRAIKTGSGKSQTDNLRTCRVWFSPVGRGN